MIYIIIPLVILFPYYLYSIIKFFINNQLIQTNGCGITKFEIKKVNNNNYFSVFYLTFFYFPLMPIKIAVTTKELSINENDYIVYKSRGCRYKIIENLKFTPKNMVLSLRPLSASVALILGEILIIYIFSILDDRFPNNMIIGIVGIWTVLISFVIGVLLSIRFIFQFMND